MPSPASYDFSRFSAVVDVGGGRGALLEALLAANPGMRGILFDQPHVVEGVRPHDRLEVVERQLLRAGARGR